MNDQLELPLCTGCGKPDCEYVQRRKAESAVRELTQQAQELGMYDPPQRLKFRTYDIMRNAIETGIAIAYRKAYKHTNWPEEEALKGHMLNEVMNELSDILDWEDA